MAISSSALKEVLAQKDNDFKQLYETHQSYEKRLEQLSERPHLTIDEELEITEIKKKKLNIKDRMHQIMEKYREETV